MFSKEKLVYFEHLGYPISGVLHTSTIQISIVSLDLLKHRISQTLGNRIEGDDSFNSSFSAVHFWF